MEHKREMRLMLSCTGVLVVGVTSVARERGRVRERERGPVVNVSVCVHVHLCPFSSTCPCAHLNVNLP
jgi:hypothetical protein